jgi:hypothetical protein
MKDLPPSLLLPPNGEKRDVRIAVSLLPDGGLRLQFDSRIEFLDLTVQQIKELGQIINRLSIKAMLERAVKK